MLTIMPAGSHKNNNGDCISLWLWPTFFYCHWFLTPPVSSRNLFSQRMKSRGLTWTSSPKSVKHKKVWMERPWTLRDDAHDDDGSQSSLSLAPSFISLVLSVLYYSHHCDDNNYYNDNDPDNDNDKVIPMVITYLMQSVKLPSFTYSLFFTQVLQTSNGLENTFMRSTQSFHIYKFSA